MPQPAIRIESRTKPPYTAEQMALCRVEFERDRKGAPARLTALLQRPITSDSLRTLLRQRGDSDRAKAQLSAPVALPAPPPLTLVADEPEADHSHCYRPTVPPPRYEHETEAPQKTRVRIGIGDVHALTQCRRVEAVMLGLIREIQPDEWVQFGDLFDCEAISDYGVQRKGWASLEEEHYEANLWLDRVQNAAPGAEGVLLGGNHDCESPAGRPGKWALKHPDAGSSLAETSVALYCRAGEYTRPGAAPLRGLKYVTVLEQPYLWGPSAYFHGLGWESVNFAKMIADRYAPVMSPGKMLFGAHMHALTSAVGITGERYQCIGWVGDPSSETATYKRKRIFPADWAASQGILVEEIYPDGSESYQVVRIDAERGRAIWNRKVITGRAA